MSHRKASSSFSTAKPTTTTIDDDDQNSFRKDANGVDDHHVIRMAIDFFRSNRIGMENMEYILHSNSILAMDGLFVQHPTTTLHNIT
ncbi:hypothetical protein DERP_012463 [Dermatophagoides pteronyssinus]|uniref:Uncharacterized protein n=1 Tax=Dermatophagoides pteronyssinus TaxID=6956 RepID=A0ABQ8IX19_DERPT|nr:hypothetical protein DERP_012463 [Dermatophagoides pteronyssinus]